MGGGAGGARVALGAELCAPLLLLCWLCCWPDDSPDSPEDTFCGLCGQNPKISVDPAPRRRAHEPLGRRLASSAASLQLPSTSGHTKQPLAAHRSHEEIRSRRKSQHEAGDQEARYHSAPSVIDEVLHRRDWERSSRELYIPLHPPSELAKESVSSQSSEGQSLDNASSIVEKNENIAGRTCKKHYTNIKCSRNKETNKKESDDDEIKEHDASEPLISNFYIGNSSCQLRNDAQYSKVEHEELDVAKSITQAQETKQPLNEFTRSKDRTKKALVPLTEFQMSTDFDAEDADDFFIDRSGAVHHSVESRSSLFGTHAIPFPPPSVEAVGYESDASYLEEASAPAAAWRRVAGGGPRARHASVGDVLAPALALRPQSAALSESDLDFELEGCDDAPPAYHEVQRLTVGDRRETAI